MQFDFGRVQTVQDVSLMEKWSLDQVKQAMHNKWNTLMSCCIWRNGSYPNEDAWLTLELVEFKMFCGPL